jgi:hypothetical protein
MVTEADIVHEQGAFFVLRVKTGYELCRNGAVAATVVGRYGHGLQQRAVADCDRRAAAEGSTRTLRDSPALR